MLKRHFLVGFVPFVLTSLKAFAQAPVTKENPVPKVVIIATIEVVPGRMNEYLPLILAHRARCLKDEPGTLAYEVFRPQDDDNTVMLYELFVDDRAFLAHRYGPSAVRIEKESKGMVGVVGGIRCRPAA